ncbi:MAG: DUF4214 domain-containing protein [Pseudomonadota bacterium]
MKLSQFTSATVALVFLSACGGSAPDTASPQAQRIAARAPAKPVADDYKQVVQQIYIAYFGRPADAGGLAWHKSVLLAANAPTTIVALSEAYASNAALKAEIDSFGTSAESAALYPGNNDTFISAIYRNLFGREADAAGKAFWVSVLDRGLITRASAAISLMAGAQSTDIDVINKKTLVASNFTAATFTERELKGYSGLAANVVVRTLLGSVDQDSDPASFTASIGSTIASLAATAEAGGLAGIPAMNSVAARAPATYPKTILAQAVATPAIPAVPAAVPAASGANNVALWLYDPRSTQALATGIFYQLKVGGSWQFVAAAANGALYLKLAAGSYEFDVVEPTGSEAVLTRHRYQLTVPSSGAASVADVTTDARSVYAVTLDVAATVPAAVQLMRDKLTTLANEPASTFTPGSSCQLIDQITPNRSFSTDLSAGFPKVRVRLPSYGRLRALIVPLDFPDVAGSDNPASFFGALANDVRDFYLKQSYGRLAMEFDIVPNWVRMPFSVSKYGFGATVNSGDFNSYRRDVLALTDTQIDYSQYDAVYFLVPKEMPFAMMGWGPATTNANWTSSGYVINGATGGADMYYNEAHGITGAMWKWMAHETGHAFGLYDEDLNHASATLGSWSIMAMNWSNHAIEHNGWDRYLQGWISGSQAACVARESLSTAGSNITLSPLVRQDMDTKVAMVPLSTSKILVIESRKNEGFDHIDASRQGVLVYTVDMKIGTLGGGYQTVRRPGSVEANYEDAALRVGESVTVDGVVVTVVASSVDGDTIKLNSK